MKILEKLNVLILFLGLALSGCGKNFLVQEFQSSTQANQDGDLILSLQAKMNLGLLFLPTVSLPIWSGGKAAGQVNIQPGNIIRVVANLNTLSEDKFDNSGTLPSGDPVPVSGVDPIFKIKLTNRSAIYFAQNSTGTLFGLALVIPELDKIGNRYPFLDIWLPFQGNSISRGLAGLFTGSTALSSGLGLFVVNPAPQPLTTLMLAKGVEDTDQPINLIVQRSSTLESQLFRMSTEKRGLSLR
jgi:hypothetical protein